MPQKDQFGGVLVAPPTRTDEFGGVAVDAAEEGLLDPGISVAEVAGDALKVGGSAVGAMVRDALTGTESIKQGMLNSAAGTLRDMDLSDLPLDESYQRYRQVRDSLAEDPRMPGIDDQVTLTEDWRPGNASPEVVQELVETGLPRERAENFAARVEDRLRPASAAERSVDLGTQQRRERLGAPFKNLAGWLEAGGEEIQKDKEAIVQQGWVAPEFADTFLVKTGGAVGSSLPQIVYTLATRGQGLKTYGPAAFQIYQESFDSAVEQGADFETAHRAGIRTMPAALLEKFGDVRIAKGLANDFADAGKLLSGKIGSKELSKRVLAERAQEATGEYITEAAQTAWQDVVANVLGIQSKAWHDIARDAHEAGKIGFASAGVMGLPGTVAQARRARKLDQLAQDFDLPLTQNELPPPPSETKNEAPSTKNESPVIDPADLQAAMTQNQVTDENRELERGSADPARLGGPAAPTMAREHETRAEPAEHALAITGAVEQIVDPGVAGVIIDPSNRPVDERSGRYINGEKRPDGTVILYAQNLENDQEAKDVVVEELGHRVYEDPAVKPLVDRLVDSLAPEQIRAMAELGYEPEVQTEESIMRLLVDESAQAEQRTMLQRVLAAIQDLLAKIGWRSTATDTRQLLRHALRSRHQLQDIAEGPRRSLGRPALDLNTASMMQDAAGSISVMPMSAVNVLHRDSHLPELQKPPKKRKNDKVAELLAQVAEQHWGRKVTSLDISDTELEAIVNMGVEEFEAAFKDSGKSASNWYSTAIEAAMAVAGVIHPELVDAKAASQWDAFKDASDPAAAADLVMRIALAVTSQNLSVELNTRFAEEQFEIFKRTGRFDDSKVYGEKAESISGNLNLANQLIDKLGFERGREFIRAEFTVRQLKDAIEAELKQKVNIDGKMDDTVNGAAIFGPKIGQGFLQNVMGNFDPVTIDLWMRRTWGRWTGDVVGAGATPERLARLLDAARDYGIDLGPIKKVRAVNRKRKSGAQFRSVSSAIEERLETDYDFAQDVLNVAKKLEGLGQRHYRLSRLPTTPAKLKDLREGRITYKAFIRNQEANERRANAAFQKSKWKGKKADFIKDWYARNGFTAQVEKAGDLKPEWSKAAAVIVNALKPIDVPSPADRRVISGVVNEVRRRLIAKGYDTTNADVQAVLWYPEKDLWAKLRGEDESNLKASYDEHFLRIAESRGLGAAASRAAGSVAGYRGGTARTGGLDEQGATVRVPRSPDQGGETATRHSLGRLASPGGPRLSRKRQGSDDGGRLGDVRSSDLTAEDFSRIAGANKAAHPFGSSVDVFAPEDYQDYELLIVEDDTGNATASISPDGELGAVTKSPGGGRELVYDVFAAAVATGKVRWLNGFDTVLPELYSRLGFEAVARIPFVDEFAPTNWDYGAYGKFNGGRPDLIFMRYTGEPRAYVSGQGQLVDDYDTGKAAALESKLSLGRHSQGARGTRRFPERVDASQDIASQIKDGVTEREYTPRSNKMDASEAAQWIEIAGGPVAAAVNFRALTHDLPGAVRMMIGQVIVKQMSANGQHEAAVSFLDNEFIELTTEVGQSLQALNAWYQLTPEGKLIWAHRQIDRARKERLAPVQDHLGQIPGALQQINEGALEKTLNHSQVQQGAQEAINAAVQEATGATPAQIKRARKNLEPEAKDSELDREIKRRIKELRMTLGAIVRRRYSQQQQIGTRLADDLVAAGLPEAAAKRLAKRVEERFKVITQRAKRKELDKLLRPAKKKGLLKKGLVDKLIEMSNLGALNEQETWEAIQQRLDLPAWTPELSADLQRQLEAIDRIPEDQIQKRQEASIEMLNTLERAKGVSLLDLAMAFYYTNLLTGPTTHAVNGWSNFAELGAGFMVELGRLIQGRQLGSIFPLIGALGQGVRKGIREGKAVWQTGNVTGSRIGNRKVQANRPLELMQFGEEGGVTLTGTGAATRLAKWALENMPLSKMLNAWKYNLRFMGMTDMVFFKAAEEGKSWLLAERAARSQGLKGEAARDYARRVLGYGGEQVAQAEKQAAEEGYEGIDAKRRAAEIAENNRLAEGTLVEDAREYALRATFNNNPYGLLGGLSDWINTAKRSEQTGLKLGANITVPFSDIISNVVNSSLNYSPIGAWRAWKAETPFGQADASPAQQAELRTELYARSFMGTTAMLAFLAALNEAFDEDDPWIELHGGGPALSKNKKGLREAGWVPYSIRVGDRYWVYAETPLQMPLAVLGNWFDRRRDASKYRSRSAERAQQSEAVQFVGAFTSIAGVVTERSFLKGLRDLFDMLSERNTEMQGRKAQQMGLRAATSFVVPNAIRQVDRMLDSNAYDAKDLEGTLIASVPFLRRENQPALNALGEPVQYNVWARFTKGAKPDPVIRFLTDNGAWPSLPGRNDWYARKGRTMNDREFQDYVETSGKAFRKSMERSLPQLRKIEDPKNVAKAVSSMMSDARARARRKLGF